MPGPIDDDDAYLEPLTPAADSSGAVDLASGALPVAVDADVVYDDLESPPQVIVKTLRPARGMTIADLDQAMVHQKLLAGGAKHWVPVLRSGPHGAGVYIAVPFFPRSVQKLISQRATLTAKQIYAILYGVLGGLTELKKIAGRPHGNLKPSNILLETGRINHRKVRLTDPSPTVLANRRGFGADLYRVGELIHQLVLLRPPRGPDAWPVPRSLEWDRLGRSGEQWRDLCNFLLSPQTDRARLRLVDVVRKLRAIFPTPIVFRPGTLLGFTLVMAVAATLSIREYRQYSAQWRVLRSQESELRAFEVGILDHRTLFASDDDLRTRLLPLADPGADQYAELDVLRFVGGKETSHPPLLPTDGPPLHWRTFQQTRAASAAIAQLKSDLAPDHWKALGFIRDHLTTAEQQKLLHFSAFLKGLIDRAEEPPSGSSILAIEQVLRARPVLEQIDLGRRDIQRQEASLSKLRISSPLLVAATRPVIQEVRDAAALDAPTSDLAGAEILAKELVTVGQRSGRWVAALPVLEDLDISQSAMETRGWHATSQKIRDAIQNFDPLSDSAIDPLTLTAITANQIKSITSKIDARRRILEESGDDVLASYGKHVDEVLASPIRDGNPVTLLTALKQLEGESAWISAQDFVSQGRWAAIDTARFKAESKIHQFFKPPQAATTEDLARWLTEAADARYRRMVVTSQPTAVVQPGISPEQARELILTRMTATTTIARDLGLQLSNRVSEIVRRWDAGRAESTRAQATALAQQQVSKLNALLSQGYALDEADGEGTSGRAILAGLTSTPAGRQMVAPLADSLTALDTGETRALRLVASQDQQPLGIRLSAWKKFLSTPLPPSRAEFELDAGICRQLLIAAQTMEPASRRTKVISSVATQFNPYWLRFLSTATTSQDVDYALSLQDAFGPLPGDQLQGPVKFDAELREVRNALPRVKTDAEAQSLAKRLLAATTTLPAAVTSGTPITTLIENLRTVAATSSSRPDFSQLGPLSPSARDRSGARISWKVEPDAEGNVITYRAIFADDPNNVDLVMVFRRVDLASGSIYLCTTETPLGLFADVVTQAGKWQVIKSQKLLWDYDPFGSDPRPGPRVWEWTRSGRRDEGIVRSLVWLSPDWLPDGVDHYPETLGREFNRQALRPPNGERPEAVNPSRRMPMQMVTPQAANYFASLVGCRLPSPEEWKAAYAMEGKPENANLRDRSWKVELQHLSRPAVRGKFRPDAGMFVPAGEPSSDEVWKTASSGDYDDGVLWFREVVPPGGSPLTFQHLAGNVGEYVQDINGKVYVIGGSALSPPSRPIDKEFQVDPLRTKGYSDVGFRLSFSAPLKLIDRLANAMPPAGWYLIAPQK